MSSEVATLQPMHLLATTPEGMEAAQTRMVTWGRQRVALAEADVAEARRTLEAARAAGFALGRFAARLRREKNKLAFYEKVGAALAAGYYIVPPFPVEVIAFRTDRRHATHRVSTYHTRFSQKVKALPGGVGEWRSPDPIVHERRIPQADGKPDKTEYWPGELIAPEFPFSLVKPEIIEATQAAMKRLFFDAIGVVTGYADPIVIGQIKQPGGRYAPSLNFFVGWWLDTRDLP